MAGKKALIGVDKAQNRFYEGLGRMSKTKRMFIFVLSFLLILGGWYYVVFAPKHKELTKLEDTLTAETRKLERYKVKSRTYRKWERKVQQVEGSFRTATSALPDKRELPALLKGISLAGSRAGLSFLLFQPDPEVDRDFYKEIPISLQVQGKYHQMAEFFYLVSQLNRIVSIRNLNMVRHPDELDVVEMNCRAVTYMFTEPTAGKVMDDQKSKKKKG